MLRLKIESNGKTHSIPGVALKLKVSLSTIQESRILSFPSRLAGFLSAFRLRRF